MATFSMTQAKAKMVDLVDRVEAGEEIVITKNGNPVAKLVPISKSVRDRRLAEGRDDKRYR